MKLLCVQFWVVYHHRAQEGSLPIFRKAPIRISVFPLVGSGKKKQSQKSVERVKLGDVVPEEDRDDARKEERFKQGHKTEWHLFLYINGLLQ